MSHRLNLVLPERSVERLERMKQRTDAASVSEVIKRALMVYESLVSHVGQGSTFTMHKRNGESIPIEFLIDIAKPKLGVVVMSNGNCGCEGGRHESR